MGTEKGRHILFSIDEFVILIAWLLSLLAILQFKAYELIFPSILAFIVINLALLFWLNKYTKPAKKNDYRQYLTIQTLFLLMWCPLLALILSMNRIDLITPWIVVLVLFYAAIGVLSFRKLVLNKKK